MAQDNWIRIEQKVDRALENQTTMLLTLTKHESILDRNTEELEEHIRRTNLLESKVKKIFTFALVAGGFVAAKYGTEILKIVGVIL